MSTVSRSVSESLLCPKCQGPTGKVRGQTEARVAGFIYRRRECLKAECGHRFTTHERPVAEAACRKTA